jgi:hypothetical protein
MHLDESGEGLKIFGGVCQSEGENIKAEELALPSKAHKLPDGST